MPRLFHMILAFTIFPCLAEADGLTPLQMQDLLRAASNTGSGWSSQNGTLAGVDASTARVSAPSATVSQTLSSKVGEHVSVVDFGAVGGASTYYLSSAAKLGDQTVTLLGSAALNVGEIVDGSGVASGTTISSVSTQTGSGPIPATSVVGLSAPLVANASIGQRLDFAIQDDFPAFVRAQESGAKYIEVPPGKTREYYLSNYAGNVAGIVWKLDGAFFAQNGGIADAVNQAMTQTLNSEALLNTMQLPQGEDTLLVTAANQPTGSTISYQKNVIHVQFNQGDPSSYGFLGDPLTAVHDLVGYSVQGHCPTGNAKCSMFGSEALMTMDPSSDGSITGYEISLVNASGSANTEMGSWNNKSGLTLIGNGSALGAAMWVNGGSWQTGIDLSTSILGKAWVVRSEGLRNTSGLATTHADYAYVDHLGQLFAQAAHVGGGVTTGDLDPIGGVSIANDAAGRIAVGNSMAPVGLQPSLEFHAGNAAASDSYSSRLVQTPLGLLVQAAAGVSSASFHPDGSTELGGFLVQTHASGIAASTTPVQLIAHFNTVTTCPPGGSVLLPASTPVGGDTFVLNRCGASLMIDPSAGAAIENNAPSIGVLIASGATQHFYLESSVEWREMQ